jgi:hypothetical protein
MSAENAIQFLDRLSNDPSLRTQLTSGGISNAQTVMDFALTKDYVFTENELKEALASYPDNPTVDQLRDRLKVAKAARMS